MLAFAIFSFSWYLTASMLPSKEVRLWMLLAWFAVAVICSIALHIHVRREGRQHEPPR